MAHTHRRSTAGWARSSAWVVLAVVVAVLALHQATDLFERLERRFFDFSAAQADRQPSEQVVVLAIDDASIRNIGRWPWSREVHAKMVSLLGEAQAKTVVLTPFFFEPQADAGLAFVSEMEQLLAGGDPADPWVSRLRALTQSAKWRLDADAQLAAALARAGNVWLPAYATPGLGLGSPSQAVPAGAVALDAQALRPHVFEPTDQVQWPMPLLAQASVGVAHLNQSPDEVDGVVRTGTWFYRHGNQVLPGLAMAAAAHALNLDPRNLAPVGDQQLALGGLRIPVDARGRVFPQYYPGSPQRPAFVTDSFYDVYAGKVAPSRYAGKVVVIGATAAGVGDRFITPVSAASSPADVTAHEISSLLSNHFFQSPDWAPAVQWLALVLVAAYLAWVLPRLGALWAAGATALLWLGLMGLGLWSISRLHTWVPLVLPAALLALGYVVLATRRFWVSEAGKLKADEESAETNRMMALALQGQGQLDMAFDRFRRVPLGEAVMDNLMNLALDFERKRQFNKAQAVYEHMSAYAQPFKDLPARLKRVKSLAEAVMLGTSAQNPSTVVLSDSVEKPMLGRYQVEKELGKGAMGVVYLGKDPKIGRVVAIKTMALAREFDGTELDEARQRFFREAETAGRLQHPNIVTIFDVGEDQDLAYIAMEFLKGQDLTGHTRVGHLLPVSQVVSIVARVAEALDYAHQFNVVHRDIKPANVMFDPASDTVKVTDFGIARVTDASRTRTGMVLGTPSFMSPEQIAGKKVDGRSDLYSLGVMAFQLLTGDLPFKADSLAELMFKIANEPAPSVRARRPDVPVVLADAVALALHKDWAVRFARGRDMAQAFRRAVASGGGAHPVNPPPAGEIDPADAAGHGFATTVLMPGGPEKHP